MAEILTSFAVVSDEFPDRECGLRDARDQADDASGDGERLHSGVVCCPRLWGLKEDAGQNRMAGKLFTSLDLHSPWLSRAVVEAVTATIRPKEQKCAPRPAHP